LRAWCTTERRIVGSGIKVRKTLETFDWAFQPGLARAAIEELAGLGFVHRKQDLLITGKSGTGKSHLLTAIAIRACQAGLAVRFARFADVLAELHAGLADGSYERRLRRWCAADFVVLDDVGLGQVPPQPDAPTAAHMLFNLIERRHQCGSTAITSNIKLSVALLIPSGSTPSPPPPSKPLRPYLRATGGPTSSRSVDGGQRVQVGQLVAVRWVSF
jgi:DNA replication protein DnaC